MMLRTLPRSSRRTAGFTLIELLVAVALLAILAVLSWRGLMPSSRAASGW